MSKDKTVSFRIDEDTFAELRSTAADREVSLSAVFREYVDEFVAHDGRVDVVPEQGVRAEAASRSESFPPTVEVPKHFVREHEHVELECEHLREQLDECKRYASTLEADLQEFEALDERLVRLEDVDYEAGTALQIE